jgi:hypothetical protein
MGGPSLLEPDRDQLEIFIDALFRHAAPQGYVSVRSFYEDGGASPFRITPTILTGGLKFLADVAEDDARRAANDPKRVVFCPPIATFVGKDRAGEKDIAEGLALSVECDQQPEAARTTLESMIGPATVVIRSGGTWTDPATGKIHDRLHLHWRLAKPARGEDLAKLKQLRDLAARIVGGDPSNKPVCHPIRWPGSWHRKGDPRLAEIVGTDSIDCELDLVTGLTILTTLAKNFTAGAGAGPGMEDAGAGAGDWGELVRNIIAGNNLHASITPLAMKMLVAGMADPAAVRLLRGILDSSSAPRDERWQARWDYVPRAVSSARAKLDEQISNNNDDDEGHWHGEANPNDSRTWAIYDLVPEVGKGLISGQWGTFKTFTALDMAHSLMSGAAFLGFDVVRRGGVAFFALEGQSEIPIRLQALIEQRGLIKGNAPFVWYDNCPSLLSADAVKGLVKRLDKAAAKLKTNFGLPLTAIFIDTIVLAAGYTKDGADNDTATTNVVLRTMAELATRTGCFVFGIDHFGKDVNVGTRGNSVKEGNADLILANLADRAISGEISNTKLAIRKRRGGANGQEFPFTTRNVDMGADQHGRPVTTLVLDWGKTAEPPKDRRDDWGKGKGLKLLRRIVMSLLVDQGVELRPWADSPMVRALKVEMVRAEFFKAHYVAAETEKAKQNAKRMAFQRAVEAAAARGVIATREIEGTEYVWLASTHAEMYAHREGS